MRIPKTVGLCAAAVAVAGLVSMSAVQDAKAKDDAAKKSLVPQFEPAGMQRYMEMCRTDHHHKQLAAWLGTWDTETKMWEMGPGQPPTVSKGTAVFSWQVENRWLKQETDGELAMGPTKMKLRGLGLLGFDRYKQKYVGSWCDSMTTNLLHFEGNFDQTEKNLMLFGSMDEPMSGEHDKCVRYVWRLAQPDRLVFEVHDLPIGEGDSKVFEVVYTRRK
jgi:hypothetical protein